MAGPRPEPSFSHQGDGPQGRGYSKPVVPLVQFVLIQFLGVRSVENARPLRMDKSAL